MKNHAPVKYGS